MNIEEFYEADERRRQSAEIELGTEWHDRDGVRCELNWVEDTGELYVLREPLPGILEDPIGDLRVSKEPLTVMVVSVLGTIATHDDLERILSGWQEAMSETDSVSWVQQHLHAAGVAAPEGAS
jgi:hypothetical protein